MYIKTAQRAQPSFVSLIYTHSHFVYSSSFMHELNDIEMKIAGERVRKRKRRGRKMYSDENEIDTLMGGNENR